MTPIQVQDEVAEVESILSASPDGAAVVDVGEQIEDPYKRLAFYVEMMETLAAVAPARDKFLQPPVDPRTFLTHPDYMGGVFNLWPKVLDAVVDCCEGEYVEAVFTGAIGTGKSTAAAAVTAYHLYLVMNLRNPHRELEIAENSEISFAFQSLQSKAAFVAGYSRFRVAIEKSPWFSEHAPFDKNATSLIKFLNHRVIVESLSGEDTGAIGENVISFVLDEVNHMKIVGQSARSATGEVYDQALQNYRALARRRESRFMRGGKPLGMVCLCGSANYAGQFTDRKRDEMERELTAHGKSNIFFFDKRAWDVQPEGRFSPERFRIYVGDGVAKPYIMRDGETPPDGNVIEVPEDYRRAFEGDIYGALKDVAGIAAAGDGFFIPSKPAIAKAFGPRANPFDPPWCDFVKHPAQLRKLAIVNPAEPRYCHIDLSLTGDSAGLCVGHASRFVKMDRGSGLVEILPEITLDAALSIRPSGGGAQIPFSKIRAVVKTLIDLGYPIKWVSLDGFQSADTIQILRGWGLLSGLLSLDKTPRPYTTFKVAIIDGRVVGVDSPLLREEVGDLRWIPQKQKVDHTTLGSKDLADCAAGVVHGVSMKREVWVRHGVPLRQIPESLRQKPGKDRVDE